MIIMSDSWLLRFVRREVRQWWRDGHVHLAVAVLAGLLCFLPIFTGQTSQLETDTIHAAISSRSVGIAAGVCFSLAGLLLVDVVLDAITTYKEARKKRKTLKEAKRESEIKETKKKAGEAMFATFTGGEKFLLSVGCLVGATAVFQADMASQNRVAGLGLVNLCARNCQIMLISGAIISAVHRFEPLWNLRLSFVVLLFIASSSVLITFAGGTMTGTAAAAGKTTVVVMFCTACFAVLGACFKWIIWNRDDGRAVQGLMRHLCNRHRATSPVDAAPVDCRTAGVTAAADAAAAAAAAPPKKKSAKEAEKEASITLFKVRAMILL